MNNKLALTLTLGLALTARIASAETFHQKIDKTLAFQPGARFTLNNVNGAVTVSTWDQPQIRIQAEKTVKAHDEADGQKLLKSVEIRISANAGGVDVETKTPDLSTGFFDWLFGSGGEAEVEYRITLPRKASLEIENVNGSIDAEGIEGNFHIETVNGRIELTRATGALDLSTVNGAIHAQMASLEPGKRHSIDTTNGGVNIELPPAARANLDVRTVNGSIRSDFPIVVNTVDDNRLSGPINGGGPALVVRTTNGSVKVVKGS
jgi:DUF4097 and DUF4098 domain-containing protein YvlB